MAYVSFKDFCVATNLASADQFDQMQANWRRERVEAGLDESFPEYLSKRNSRTESEFLSNVAKAFDWERIELAGVKPTPEAHRRISSKIAAQHRVVPVEVMDGQLVVAVSETD